MGLHNNDYMITNNILMNIIYIYIYIYIYIIYAYILLFFIKNCILYYTIITFYNTL